MESIRRQNSSGHPILLKLVSSTDHFTPITGATLTVTLSKDGAASFSAAAGTITEAGNGLYWLNGNAADRDTLGDVALHATAAGADPFDTTYMVVPWDAFLSGTTNALATCDSHGNVQADVSRWGGTIIGLSSGLPNVSVGNMQNGVLTPAVLPATGFNYTHGIDLTSDQGTPAFAVRSTSGFGAFFIGNTSTGDALTISNSGTGTSLRVTGPFVGAAIVQAVWDALASALITADSIGKAFTQWLSTLGSDHKVTISADAGSNPDPVLTITPIQASISNPRYATRDLPPIAQNSTPTDFWIITDGAGNAVNLSGKTVRLVGYKSAQPTDDCDPFDAELTALWKYETGGSGITVTGTGNNQVNVAQTALSTATAGHLYYILWNVTDGIPLAKGKYPVEPAVMDA